MKINFICIQKMTPTDYDNYADFDKSCLDFDKYYNYEEAEKLRRSHPIYDYEI